jgi:hypothetical protein
MKLLLLMSHGLLALSTLGLAASDTKSKNGKKPSEATKEEKANTKLPPCAACGNLVASFDQVKLFS